MREGDDRQFVLLPVPGQPTRLSRSSGWSILIP